MSNFRDIVTNFSIGAISKNKVVFYAKRLSKETATRRLASVLMIGLLIFQFFTFLVPPKPSYASSPGDLVSGGPFSKASIISTVWDQNPGGIQQVFGRLQITREKMNAAGVGSACKGQGWQSMGRFNAPNSYQWQPGIWMGPAESRWQQNCFTSLIGNEKIQDTDTGTWYEWGVILDCGNIILRETTPPPPPPAEKSFSCATLNYTVPGPVPVGAEVGYRGYASGTNVSGGDLVDMAYGVYDSNNNLAFPLQAANGVGQESPGNFVDGTLRVFKFDKPGTYTIKLVVFYDVGGTKYFAAGSGAGNCSRQLTVQQPRTLVCKDLSMPVTTAQAPFTPKLAGESAIVGDIGTAPTGKVYTYLLLKEVPKGTSGPVVPFNNTYYQETAPRIVHDNVNALRDPASGYFDAPTFKRDVAGNYLVILRVTSNTGVAAPENTDCFQPFTVTPQPKDFTCLKLTANPDKADKVPFETTFTAKASVLNTSIKEYQFDYGDGKKEVVATDKLEAVKKHTYASGGKYTAKVTVVGTDSAVKSSKPSCTQEISIEEVKYAKKVQNNTILTTDNKPTDANGQVARPGDKITYTIGIASIGASPVKGFIFRDNISDILQYADMVDAGGGKLVTENNQTFIEWPPVDVPVSIKQDAPTYVVKSFTVQVKNPLPTNASKPTDPYNYNCSMEDEFFGNIVATPLSVNPAKRLECMAKELPKTGAGIPIAFIGFFAATSLYLFFRNRLLKREIQLVETLNDGASTNGQ